MHIIENNNNNTAEKAKIIYIIKYIINSDCENLNRAKNKQCSTRYDNNNFVMIEIKHSIINNKYLHTFNVSIININQI